MVFLCIYLCVIGIWYLIFSARRHTHTCSGKAHSGW